MASSEPQRPSTPSEVYRTLMEGNDRFVDGTPAHPNQDASRRQALGQATGRSQESASGVSVTPLASSFATRLTLPSARR